MKWWRSTYVSPGNQAAAERRVGHDSDAQLAGGLQEADLLVLDVEREW